MDETKPIEELWTALDGILPPQWRSGPVAALLEGLSFADALVSSDGDDKFTLTVTISADAPLDLAIPGLPEFGITVGEFDSFGYSLELGYDAGVLSLAVVDVPITIYLPDSFLRPVDEEDGLALIGVGMLRVSSVGEFEIKLADGLDLPPCQLGDSGVVIAASGLKLDLSVADSPPEVLAAGFGESFVGLYFQEVRVALPAGLPGLVPEDLILKKCVIGSGGVSGELDLTYAPAYDAATRKFSGPGAGELFGIPVGLERVELVVRKNALTKSSLAGRLLLPFFDEPIDVDLGFDLDGNVTVEITGSGGNALKTLTKPNVMSMELDSIGAEIADGTFSLKLSGKLTPLFGADKGLKWPTFDIKELSIDSEGHVHFDGGWLTLPQQQTLDFYGFKIEISQLGFGKNEDGSKWVGFSGGLKLVDGLQAGASVEGLRITWFEGSLPKISLNGAGVELKIPGVLELKGSVSFKEITDQLTGEEVKRFDGDIHVTLETPELEIDGMMVIGSVKGPLGRYNFFAIYADVALPTGLPLASTGLGIYGFAGLVALQMEPNKKPEEMWFSIDHGKSFYHRGDPGITDLKNKWEPRKGSFALGAGITLGTLSDNGYTFNGKFLLAIVLPGPIIMLQGAASFLKKRAEGTDEGQFRALAVLDGRAGSVLIGLDAEYKTGKGGELLQIGGSLEAYYAFRDPTAWHLYLGLKEPRELRIRALFARLVEANAYFMLDAHQLAVGAWFGYANAWKFGPLQVTLEAWAEGNALLSFKPTHFHGDLWLHCLLELKVFGIGLGLSLDAKIAADLFKPYHLLGTFSVGIKLPWPFKKKISAKVVLEWKPLPLPPPLSLPVTEVAAEHFKSTVVWPLPRGKYLRPNWSDGDGFLAGPTGASDPDLATVPLVPLDARLSVTFGRSVHDLAKVGINLQPIVPAEEDIGHPGGGPIAKVRYELAGLELHRKVGASWQLVASSPQSGSTPALFGSWLPGPQLPDGGAQPPARGQTKLLAWSKTPFDFTRATGSTWEEWVTDAWPEYPCVPLLPAEEICFGFDDLAPGTLVRSPWTHPGPPAFTLSWGFGPAVVQVGQVTQPGAPVRTVSYLCFPAAALRRGVRVRSSAPGRSFRLVLAPAVQTINLRPVAPPQAAPDAGPRPVTLPWTTSDATRICVDLRSRTAGTVANPWSAEGVRFTVRGADGGPLPLARLERWGKGSIGLAAGFRLDVALPCASDWVELIVTHRPPFRVVAFNGAGAAVASHAPAGTGGETTETIRLEGRGITRLEVHAAGNEKLVHSVCYACAPATGPSVTWYDSEGFPHGPYFPADDGDDVIAEGPGVVEVVWTGEDRPCLEKICVTPDPEAGLGVGREEIIQHIRDELARWQGEGAVLAPHTTYRLTVRTRVVPTPLLQGLSFPQADRNPVEHAYFRTEGPPGLVDLLPPEGVAADTFDSGLEDLVRYVRETDPPTVPLPGEKPILFKPFYRAYDVGVEFNEDYVEQMYRMDGRDLGLYLYDNNNQPARDARGRLLALANRWGRTETLTLSEKETRWLTLIDAATCLPEKPDPRTFPHDATLVSAEERVLAPDTLHEARLVPLLLHESFTAGSVGTAPPGWLADDAGAGGPSLWRLGEVGDPASRFVEQASGIGGAGEPARPGTVLLLAGPAAGAWTDYRLSVYARAAAGGAVGVVFRHGGGGSWYRFALDERGRRLVKAGPAGVTVLAADHVGSRRNRDYLLTVEAIGTSLRTYVDGAPVFAVEDGDLAAGRIGLYVCQSPGARFTDVRVDDFRAAAPVVYRFQLTTSLYANFFHHLHGFDDLTWSGSLGPEAAAPLALAAPPSFAPPGEAEARAYDELADLALKAEARQNPPRVEVTRLALPAGGPALLLRSPEPLAWQRVELSLSRPAHTLPAPRPPGDLKLTDVAFGTLSPAEEAVTLLLREAADLTRHRIELRQLPGPLAEPAGDPFLAIESFGDPAALGRFAVVDLGTDGGPSDWRIEGGALLQLAPIAGGAEPELPGTQALTGDAEWTDYRLAAELRSDAGSSLGVVFRWRDADNHYRLSADATLRFRRLVKREAGVVTILWEDAGRYAPGEPFRLEIEAVGPRLTGFLDAVRLFTLTDAAHAAGQVGIYAWNDPTARCERLEVRRPSLEGQALLRDAFAAGDLAGWSLLSEVSTVPLAQAVAWETAGGALRLRSLLARGGAPDFPGALAAAGDAAWTDVVFQVRLRSPGGAIGVVFRGQNLASYYRFAMSRDQGFRQLVRKSGGQTQVLWQDGVLYEADRTYELTVVAAGASLRGWLDGVPLFAVEDAAVPAGRIALYAWNNPEAWFSAVRVWPAERAYAAWTLDEPFAVAAGGRWTFHDEAGEPDPVAWTAGGGELRAEPDPVVWEAAGEGVDGRARALAVAGDGVYAGGDFLHAGGVPANRIALWTGSAWQALGAGLDGPVRALAVDGDRVYVGGQFAQAGGSAAANVAVWDRGAGTWSALGGGVNGPVLALAVLGDLLYAGGQFTAAGGVAAANLAVWDRQAGSWSEVGGGVNAQVLALAVRGSRLYVGGRFTQAGGTPASRIALWDGASWAAAAGTVNGPVSAIAVAAGSGALFIGGGFTQAGGVAASRIARWTGSAWAPLGAGADGPVDALTLDGGQLWAGGRFTQAGGASASRIARWSLAVQTWSPVGEGLPDGVFALAANGNRLWAGGDFTAAPTGSPVQRIAALLLGRTRFALSATPAPGDFRLAVRLVPGSDGAAAVVLRFADAAHYLAFWLDAEQGQRRLVRTDGGISEVLWQDGVRPAAGREHAVTIDAVGDRLVGFVDGVPVFDLAVPDAAPAPLRAGVAVWRSPDARCHEVRLAVPAWTLWHAFGDEERLLAGTRVRVHAAPPVSSGPREPGVVLRSAALAGESGGLRLSTRGADLRVVAPDGAVGHTRGFLGPDAYAPVSVQVIRKADGTSVFLLPGGDAAARSVRLQLTYHRDRQDAGRTFRQAGDARAEQVILDIP